MAMDVLPARRFVLTAVALAACGAAVAAQLRAQTPRLDPIVYTIRFPDPASKSFTVDMTVPTSQRPSIDLMMAIWSPGFYGLQNYADRVTSFSAKAPDGSPLDVTK